MPGTLMCRMIEIAYQHEKVCFTDVRLRRKMKTERHLPTAQLKDLAIISNSGSYHFYVRTPDCIVVCFLVDPQLPNCLV